MLQLALMLLLEPARETDASPSAPLGARAPPRPAPSWAEAVGARERRLQAIGPGLVNEPLARTFLRLKGTALAHARAKGARPGSVSSEQAVEEALRQKARALPPPILSRAFAAVAPVL